MRKVYSVFTNNKGEPLSDIIVKFRIVGKNRQQISVEDKYTGEVVLDREIGVQSDKLGRMEVELWENSRSNTENYYLVELVLDRIFRHIIFLPQGDHPIELYKLIAESEKNPRHNWTSDLITRGLNNLITGINQSKFRFTSAGVATEHLVEHNLNSVEVSVMVWTESDGVWQNDLVGISIVDSNKVKIDLTDGRKVKVLIQKLDDIALV